MRRPTADDFERWEQLKKRHYMLVKQVEELVVKATGKGIVPTKVYLGKSESDEASAIVELGGAYLPARFDYGLERRYDRFVGLEVLRVDRSHYLAVGG